MDLRSTAGRQAGWRRAASTLLALLLISATSTPAAHAWRQEPKPCAEGCTERGNCNAELGLCECPYGWQGPTCEEPVLGACRLNLTSPVVMHGFATVKACECLRQINATFTWNLTVPGFKKPQLLRHHPVLGMWDGILCFDRTGVPAEEQHSDIPEPDEPQEWYEGKVSRHPNYTVINLHLNKLPGRPKAVRGPRGPPEEQEYLPLSRCQDGCHARGACVSRRWKAPPGSAEGMCLCTRGFRGDSCAEEHLHAVSPVSCSGRGRLRGSWCHCEAGWWGQHCTRSTAWAPDPKQALEVDGMAFNRTHAKVYVYELPWQVSFPLASWDFMNFEHGVIYAAEDEFYKALATDSEVLTENPGEANLFYVRAQQMMYGNNVNPSNEQMWVILAHLADVYPQLVMRHRAKDHFFFALNDHGTCTLSGNEFVTNMIKLESWGPVDNRDLGKDVKPGTFVRSFSKSCFNPTRDIVLPVPFPPQLRNRLPSLLAPSAATLHRQAGGGRSGGAGQGAASTSTATSKAVLSTRRALLASRAPPIDVLAKPRQYVAYFGGSFRLESLDYSGGSRQAFHEAFVKDPASTPPDLKVGGPGDDMVLESEFCVIMTGEGFPNTRLSISVISGCIPVIVMDFVHQPFHDVLPWGRMSVRLRHDEIPRMMELLRAIPKEQRAHMRRTLVHHAHAFDWHGHHRGPYNLTMYSLHQRLTYMWGLTYRRRALIGGGGACAWAARLLRRHRLF